MSTAKMFWVLNACLTIRISTNDVKWTRDIHFFIQSSVHLCIFKPLFINWKVKILGSELDMIQPGRPYKWEPASAEGEPKLMPMQHKTFAEIKSCVGQADDLTTPVI